MEIRNDTPFALAHFALFDREGAESLVVICKGSFDLPRGQDPVVAEEQEPPRAADVYSGEPGQSGLLAEGELAPPRPSTGLTVSGSAIAPKSGTTAMKVGVRLAQLRVDAVVFGERHWITTLGIARASRPQPFESVPLTWENAFGGVDLSASKEKHQASCESNPAGRGFVASHSRRKIDALPLPQVENPRQLIRSIKDHPEPVCFLPVAPAWRPRRDWAGSYDETWQKTRAPLLPLDFDERFYQAAPPALTCDSYLAGGEICTITGMTPEGELSFALPEVHPRVKLRFHGAAFGLPMKLDAVHVDTERMLLQLTWRGMMAAHGRLDAARGIHAAL